MPGHRPAIAILLAAYNGESYIAAQIESILSQSWPHWKLFVRDDGSRDDTPSIVPRYAGRYPDRIFLLPSGEGPMGADNNFSYLLEHVESDYFMFCDQDDVWLPRKVESSLRCMRALEEHHRADSPLLVHTDLRVVDAR